MYSKKIPGFTAEQSLQSAQGQYRSGYVSMSQPDAVIPAIPACRNCDYILERCANNGGRPRAVCAACASGRCYDDPPMPNPFPDPFDPLPRF